MHCNNQTLSCKIPSLSSIAAVVPSLVSCKVYTFSYHLQHSCLVNCKGCTFSRELAAVCLAACSSVWSHRLLSSSAPCCSSLRSEASSAVLSDLTSSLILPSCRQHKSLSSWLDPKKPCKTCPVIRAKLPVALWPRYTVEVAVQAHI